MRRDYVIIGGGIAGLCAAIRLTELGVFPVVVEGGNYPAHKVCGEFISPDGLEVLRKWNIAPIEIQKVKFHTPSETLDFSFHSPAGSLSHITFDPLLVQRAKEGGATILTNTKVSQLSFEQSIHEIVLSTGETLQASNLIIAVGRLPLALPIPTEMKYVGIKAHFEGIPLDNTLEMFLFKGAYAGISPIEDGKYNVACLAQAGYANQWNSSVLFMNHLMSQNELLQHYLSRGKCLFSDWMRGSIPEFGIKDIPKWPNTYFIGDAMGTIPPITGNGLSMAIRGGIMAAEFAKRKDTKGFENAWRKKFKKPIFYGKVCHQVLMQPTLSKHVVKLGKMLPALMQTAFHLTR